MEIIFWSCIFGILNASCTWLSIHFLRFGKFSAIISLKKFSVPLLCMMESSCMLKIHIWSFNFIPKSCCSVIISCFSSLLSELDHLFSNPDITSSTSSHLLMRLSTEFFISLGSFSFPRFLLGSFTRCLSLY
jgi:hypothetical protein